MSINITNQCPFGSGGAPEDKARLIRDPRHMVVAAVDGVIGSSDNWCAAHMPASSSAACSDRR
jgi:hypothetical protein